MNNIHQGTHRMSGVKFPVFSQISPSKFIFSLYQILISGLYRSLSMFINNAFLMNLINKTKDTNCRENRKIWAMCILSLQCISRPPILESRQSRRLRQRHHQIKYPVAYVPCISPNNNIPCVFSLQGIFKAISPVSEYCVYPNSDMCSLHLGPVCIYNKCTSKTHFSHGDNNLAYRDTTVHIYRRTTGEGCLTIGVILKSVLCLQKT